MKEIKMYQVSTLQALALGYTRAVIDVEELMKHGHAKLDKINLIELQLPTEPVFDTYSLKEASEDEIKKVEQGKE